MEYNNENNKINIFKEKRIYSFDAFRLIFCISIFLNHCTFFKDSICGDKVFERLFHNGRFGVTFFFIVSAFCIYKGYSGRKIEYFNFVWNRVKKIYFLYISTMIYVALYRMANGDTVFTILGQLVLSATMLQSLTVKYWGILNSVGWYLSTLFIMYLFSPLMIKLVDKINGKLISVISLILVCIIPFIDYVIFDLSNKGIIGLETANLLNYIFPIYWIPIYLLGMLSAKWKEININATVQEIFVLAFVFVCYYLGLSCGGLVNRYKSVLYVIACIMLIYVFSMEKGIVSTCLSNSVLAKMGGWSTEIYLIHYIVIYYGGMELFGQTSTTILGAIIECISLLIITCAIGVLWRKIYNGVKK